MALRCNFCPTIILRDPVGAFNQEKALVEGFSVIVKTSQMVRLQL